jgi:CBS domain-containing protein
MMQRLATSARSEVSLPAHAYDPPGTAPARLERRGAITMRCASVMHQPVVTIGAHVSAQRAAQLMKEHGIGFLPVCDDAGRAIGTVTDRDLAVRVCAAASDTARVPVGDVMTAKVVACRAADSIVCVEELMVRHRKQRILVVDDAKRPGRRSRRSPRPANLRRSSAARSWSTASLSTRCTSTSAASPASSASRRTAAIVRRSSRAAPQRRPSTRPTSTTSRAPTS